MTLHAWLEDDTFLYGRRLGAGKTVAGAEVWLTSISGDGKNVPVIQNQFWNPFCALSADRRWLAYASNESGRFDVYAMPFPSGGGKWPISVAGGTEPAWRADGKELFYLAPDRYVMAVPIKVGSITRSLAHRNASSRPRCPRISARLILEINMSSPAMASGFSSISRSEERPFPP